MPFKPGPELKAAPFQRKGGALGPQTLNLQTEGKPPPPKGPSGFRIEDRIGVQAPADVIWDVVQHLPGWAEWNPVYPRAEGEIRIGNVLSFDLALPGQGTQAIKATVLDWVPGEQLHWQLRMMGGLIKTLRYIEITPLSDQGCVVDNGEIFGGLMGPSLGKRMRGPIRRGFQAMNEALKERAEAEWAKRKG